MNKSNHNSTPAHVHPGTVVLCRLNGSVTQNVMRPMMIRAANWVELDRDTYKADVHERLSFLRSYEIFYGDADDHRASIDGRRIGNSDLIIQFK